MPQGRYNSVGSWAGCLAFDWILEGMRLGIATVPMGRPKHYKAGKAPEQNPRHNKGKRPKDRFRVEVDIESLLYLPTVITKQPQQDFPRCSTCLVEMTIQQGNDPTQERQIMCPKTLFPGRQVAVPSSKARICTGTAAPLSREEQLMFIRGMEES